MRCETHPCVTSRMRCDRRTRITGRCKAYPHNDVTRETHHTSLSNITTVAYTASRVRWERFRVYFCRAYKLFVETFCFVANANIITTVAYTASRVHWERFCVSFKTKSERTTCLLYNVLLCF